MKEVTPMRHGKVSGFVLLSTMLVVLVLGLLLRVAIIRMPSVLGAAGHSAAHEQAERAARSGVEFALTQLREDPEWRGGESGKTTLLDQPGVLTVVQDQGNVLGTISEPNGARSEFRLRFNYQDGSGANGDARPDPAADMSFAIPFVSVNNLGSDVEALVPRADGPGNSVPATPTGHNTPGLSVCLLVEGRALTSDGEGVAARSVSESVYLLSTDRAITDAVLMAGGGIDMKIGMGDNRVVLGGSLVKQASDELLRMRTKGGVKLSRSDGSAATVRLADGTRGEINYNSSQGFIGSLPANGKLVANEEDAGKDFYNLPWDSVKKASGGNSVQLPGGVYAYGNYGDGRQMYYFNESYETYKNRPTPPTAAEGKLVSPDFGSVRTDSLGDLTGKLAIKPTALSEMVKVSTGGRGGTTYMEIPVPGFQMTVKDVDIRVVPSANNVTSTIAVVPHSPTQWSSLETEPLPARADDFTPDEMKIVLSNTTISAEDNVTLHGGISGKSGTITSTGDVQMLAGRTMLLETKGRTKAQVEQELEGPNGPTPADDPVDPGTPDGTPDDPNADTAGSNSSLQLNVYAKGRLRVSTFSKRISDGQGEFRPGYRNLTFKGLLYSWKDVDIVATDAPTFPATGIFTLRGAMVSYGADPQSGEPGSESPDPADPTRLGGKVSVKARSAKLYWDPRFIPIKDLQGDSGSGFTLKQFSVSFPQK